MEEGRKVERFQSIKRTNGNGTQISEKAECLSLVHIKSSERSLCHDFLFESVTILKISGFHTSFSPQQ